MPLPPEGQRLEAAMIEAQRKYVEWVNTNWPDTPPEPEPVPPGQPCRFGIYPGATTANWVDVVRDFEARTKIDVVQVGGNQDQRYEGARGSVAGVFGSKVPVPTITCAIQLAFTGGPYGDTQGKKPGAVKRNALQATINGENDSIYEANLALMQASPFSQIILRLGSEGDIPFPPHSFVPGTETNARGNDDVYRQAWRHVRDIFVTLGSRVRFSYTTTMFAAEQTMVCSDGTTRTCLEAGYPGGCDIIGIDSYLGSPLTTVQRLVGKGVEFARVKGKPVAFDEWGITPSAQTAMTNQEKCAYMHWVGQVTDRFEYASFFAGWAASKWPADYALPVQQCLIEAWS